MSVSIDPIDRIEQEISFLRSDFERKKAADISTEDLEDYSNKIRTQENILKSLETNLQKAKDRTWIFFESSTEKNKEINTKLDRINTLKGIVSAIKTSVKGMVQSKVVKPARVEAARREILGRETKRKAELDAHAVKGSNIRRRAQDNFTRAFFTDPLNRAEANELLTTERDLDKVRMAGVNANIFEKSSTELANLAEDIAGTAKLVGSETFFSAGKTMALLLAWPVILPMKALNYVSDLVSRGCRATEAFFQTFNEYAHESADKSNSLLPKIGWNAIRLVTGGITLAAATLKGVTRLAANLFDTDNMLRTGKMGAAFGMGWVGAALLITFALASVFTFGIPIAMVAMGAGFAAVVGLAKIGIEYNKFSEKRSARRKFRLTSEEETQLLEYAERNNAQALVASNRNENVEVQPKVNNVIPSVEVTPSKPQVRMEEPSPTFVPSRTMDKAMDKKRGQEQNVNNKEHKPERIIPEEFSRRLPLSDEEQSPTPKAPKKPKTD